MYNEEDVERGESENVQTRNNKVKENGEKIMKKNLQKLHAQRKCWRGHNKNSLCWAFYCVDDGKEVEVASHQVMRCILCYQKGLIIYNKIYGITAITKHVDANHFIIVKIFEEEINNETIGIIEKQPAKKMPNVPTSVISFFLL
jgi:hypothetical protein